MYLKSLEIQGFKSFPDRISLTFDKGLTAVVGPNGSGKSNIGDSVRWVLGEQSTKTLRGNKMEDVIFSGTVARKPMGFAAVTINIDNSDHTIEDMEEEIAVTRKLYRSGESEYLINGRQCRLKDINELFMDTGLGRDGYSIIGQGRIAEIVGAKSNERRDIFEEAAGISKFRYKKQEAERRLTAAQENLLRLTDILSELESRVGPLKAQAEKAEKFVQLANERKELEISVWVTRLDELKAKLEGLEEKLLISNSEYENLENDIAAQEDKLQQGYRRMQESTMKSDELSRTMLEEEQESSRKKAETAVLENDIKHCEEAIRSAKRSITDADETRRELNLQKRDIAKKIELLKKQKTELEAQIAQIEEEFRSAEKENSRLGIKVEETVSEINKMYIRQSSLNITAETARQTIAEQRRRLEELRDSSSSAGSIVAEYTQQLADSESAVKANAEKLTAAKNRLAGIEKLFQSRSQGFEDAKTELEKVLYDFKGRQQRRKILSDMESNMEGSAGSVKQILRASRQGRIGGIFGTVAQNISVSPEYALAIETALGGAMQNIIVENEDIAKRCIRFLKEQKGGRATFLPLTSVKGYTLRETGLENCQGFIGIADSIAGCDSRFSSVLSSLLGRTVVAEDIDSATNIAKKYSYRFRIVTLDGQVINSGGSFTGGSAVKSGGVITRKNEIDTLDREMQELSVKRDELSAKAEKLRAETEKLRFDVEAAKSEIAECNGEEVRLNAEISRLSSLIGQMSGQSEAAEKQVREAEEKISDSQHTIEETENSLAELAKEIAQAEEERLEGQRSRETLRLERAELSEKLSSLRISSMALDKDIQAQELETSRTEQSLKDLDSGSDRFEEEIRRQQTLISQKNQEITRINTELENTKNNAENYRREIKRYQDIHTEQTRLVNEIQKGIKELNDAKERLSGEKTRLEERRDAVVRDSDYIIRQLGEVYELTRSEAVAMAKKLDDLADAQRRLTEVKNKIRGLGSVNVDAIEEYKEVSERYEFMTRQLADVQKSKAELERIISGLTEEMCRIFSDSFRIINSNFKSIFTELFGGGKGELILTDPDNVLESGIEISVAPPGKVIKNLISLSGGEQSFVAIAIYFAILRLRPAPFCILDEIDAALDEVNVRKYAQYLKKFTDTTQFVLVTHRRSAMEEANVLYGVTMQEDGISKLLKMEQVDFQEDVADVQQQ